MRKNTIIMIILLLLYPALTWSEFNEMPEEVLEEPVIGVTQSMPPAEVVSMPLVTCPKCLKCPPLIYRQPLVARITIPARIHHGYFVARHEAYVVLKPGYDHVVNNSNQIRTGAAPMSQACPVRKER